MPIKKVLLIGGSGFVGGFIASQLAEQGIRVIIPTRRRERNKALILLPTVYMVDADVHDPKTLSSLMHGVDAVINLVGVLHDRDNARPYGRRFARAHVELPQKIVTAMQLAGMRRLVHMSALNASTEASSAYMRSKAAGEAAVFAAGNSLDVTVFRPSIIFGPGDAFLNTFAKLMQFSPVLPIPGANARFQPVFVGDVAKAMVACLGDSATYAQSYTLCGPKVYTLREMIHYTAALLHQRVCLIELPAPLAYLQAKLLSYLPYPPMSPDNLLMMRQDSVSDGLHDYPDWQPQALSAIVPTYLGQSTAKLRYNTLRTHAGR